MKNEQTSINIRRLFCVSLSLSACVACYFSGSSVSNLKTDEQSLLPIREIEQMRQANQDLIRQLSAQTADSWQIETLKAQAKDVHRLRGQVGELSRLRRENETLILQTNQLANRIENLTRQNEELLLSKNSGADIERKLSTEILSLVQAASGGVQHYSEYEAEMPHQGGLEHAESGSTPALQIEASGRLPERFSRTGHPVTTESCATCHRVGSVSAWERQHYNTLRERTRRVNTNPDLQP